MAQTKKKRRRKHAGTQAGTVERRGRTSKPVAGSSSRASGSARSAATRPNRLDKPPTWQSSTIRAAVSAVLFGVVVVLLFRQPPLQGLILGSLMFLLYIPMSYYTDRFLYNRRQKKLAEGRS
jgi:hypothetical protein